MNNACPTCNAVYAVTSKDVGRKIKCKKCGTALRVDDSGLVADGPGGAPPPVPAAPLASAVADDDGADDDVVAPRGRKAKRSGGGGGGVAVGEFVRKIGGVPTVLFGLGTFFVLYFFFQPVLANASLNRADGGVERVELERGQKLRKLAYDEAKLAEDLEAKDITVEKFEERMKDIRKEKKKIAKDYDPKVDEAKDNKAETSISGKRWSWLDNFGLMVGFLLLSFGCIGYVRGDAPLVVRIVGGTILTVLMMAVFAKFSGCNR